jgi:hypothetical protein
VRTRFLKRVRRSRLQRFKCLPLWNQPFSSLRGSNATPAGSDLIWRVSCMACVREKRVPVEKRGEWSPRLCGRNRPPARWSPSFSACDCIEFPASLQISRVNDRNYRKPLSTNCRLHLRQRRLTHSYFWRTRELDGHSPRNATRHISEFKRTEQLNGAPGRPTGGCLPNISPIVLTPSGADAFLRLLAELTSSFPQFTRKESSSDTPRTFGRRISGS